ncbi:MAG: hypothetical protein HZB19_19055 [Chloroflexi bacterium]|nr:hypothetical protein [Chloroflexota bacterium]
MLFNTMPDLLSSEIAEIKKLSWRVDCSSMAIKSRSQNPVNFYGPGTIYQTQNGELRFKLYVTRKKIKQNRITPHLRAGQVIPDSAYFDFSAIDHYGRKWKSERIRLRNSDFIFIENTAVIDEQLSEIACHARAPKSLTYKNDSLAIWVFDDIEIPCNEMTVERRSIAHKRAAYSGILNAWKFRTLGINFLLIKKEKELLEVRCSTGLGKYPFLLEDRVIEALQFMLGRPIPWTIVRMQKRQNLITKISSKKHLIGRSRLQPPLPASSIVKPGTRRVTTKYHRKLFECYLMHSLTSGFKRHPIWGFLNAVYEAGTSSFIDSEALTLVVAIEGLIQSEFSGLVHLSKKDKKAISNLQTYIENWDGDTTIKKRAKGTISQFHRVRVGDIMLRLEKVGAITVEQKVNWEVLRHPSAHAFQTGSLSGDKMRELLPSVKLLFYHLIFYAIGYRGLYMDISSLDWPLKEYRPRALRKLAKRRDM